MLNGKKFPCVGLFVLIIALYRIEASIFIYMSTNLSGMFSHSLCCAFLEFTSVPKESLSCHLWQEVIIIIFQRISPILSICRITLPPALFHEWSFRLQSVAETLGDFLITVGDSLNDVGRDTDSSVTGCHFKEMRPNLLNTAFPD